LVPGFIASSKFTPVALCVCIFLDLPLPLHPDLHCILPSPPQAKEWIDAALASGGAVLVHCHEGKSRSVTLLLAYLMMSSNLTLAAALAHMRQLHPKASPNAGGYTALLHVICLVS
jgi:protein-tyrosine phosphatase